MYFLSTIQVTSSLGLEYTWLKNCINLKKVRIQDLTENYSFLVKLSQGMEKDIWKSFLGKNLAKKFSKTALVRKNLRVFWRMESRLSVRNIKKLETVFGRKFCIVLYSSNPFGNPADNHKRCDDVISIHPGLAEDFLPFWRPHPRHEDFVEVQLSSIPWRKANENGSS